MTDKERENFANNMRTLRSELNMTQEQFGAFVGTHKKAISSYELGKTAPNIQNLRKFALRLGYSPRELVGGLI